MIWNSLAGGYPAWERGCLDYNHVIKPNEIANRVGWIAADDGSKTLLVAAPAE